MKIVILVMGLIALGGIVIRVALYLFGYEQDTEKKERDLEDQAFWH